MRVRTRSTTRLGRGQRLAIGGGRRAAGGVGVCIFAGGGARVSRAGTGGRGGVWLGAVRTRRRRGGDDGIAVGRDAAWDGVLHGAGQRVGGGQSFLGCVDLCEWRGDERRGEAAGPAAAVWRKRGRAGAGGGGPTTAVATQTTRIRSGSCFSSMRSMSSGGNFRQSPRRAMRDFTN